MPEKVQQNREKQQKSLFHHHLQMKIIIRSSIHQKNSLKNDLSVNLKRRRDSGETSREKNVVRNHSPNQNYNLHRKPSQNLNHNLSAQHKSHYHINPLTPNIHHSQTQIRKLPYLQLCPLFHLPGSSLGLIRKPGITRQHRTKSASNEDRQGLIGLIFADTLDSLIIDNQLKKMLNPLISLKTIDKNQKVSNPYLFRDAPMVTTFVCSVDNRTKVLWRFPASSRRHPPSRGLPVRSRQ